LIWSWCQFYGADGFEKTFAAHKLEKGTFNDDFHTFGMVWNEDGLYTYIDNDNNKLLSVDFRSESFWQRGAYGDKLSNPWAGRPNAAPFDQNFYLIFNVAVGGISEFFPDGQDHKPWTNHDMDAPLKFHEATKQWHSTWAGRDSALQIRSVRVWQPKGPSPAAHTAAAHTNTNKLGAVGPAATKSEGAAYTDGQGGNANGTTPRAEIMNTVAFVVLGVALLGGAVFAGYLLYKRRYAYTYTTISV
jgi:hypothetical protein